MQLRKVLGSLGTVALALSLMACGKKTEYDRETGHSRGAGTANASASFGNCTGGYVYSGSSSIRNEVIGLLSATMDPQNIGEVSGMPGASTGIDFYLKLRISNGQVVLPEAKLQMVIFDSFVGMDSTVNPGQKVQPIPVTMSTANASSPASGQQFHVDFQDQYGIIRVTISQVTQSGIYGTVEYSNGTSAVSGSPQSGVLGQFVVPSCAVTFQ